MPVNIFPIFGSFTALNLGPIIWDSVATVSRETTNTRTKQKAGK